MKRTFLLYFILLLCMSVPGFAQNPPEVRNPIRDFTLTVRCDNFIRDLKDKPVFSDPNGDPITHTVVSSNTTIADAQVSSEQVLTITPKAEGEVTITLIASDDENPPQSTSDTIMVRVITNNQPPDSLGAIPQKNLTLGCMETGTEGLSQFFSDKDSDVLTFEAQSSDNAVVEVDVQNNVLELTAKADGNATITVTARDGKGCKATSSFNVVVQQNSAPTVQNPIAPIGLTFGPGCPPYRRSLEQDPVVFVDCGPLTYTVTSLDSSIAIADTISGNILQVRGFKTGATTITVTATDQGGASTRLDVDVTTTQNQPPVASVARDTCILTVEVHTESNPKTIDLTTRFQDDGSLTYSPTRLASSNFGGRIDGNELKLWVEENARGDTTIALNATDGCGARATSSLTIVVNHRPVVAKPITFPTLSVGGLNSRPRLDYPVQGVFSDPDPEDNNRLRYSAMSSDANIVKASITNRNDSVRVNAFKPGVVIVTVQADDRRGGMRDMAFPVVVVNSNNAPILAKPIIVSQPIILGRDILTINLRDSSYFIDPDGDEVFYTAQSLKGKTTAGITGQIFLIITPKAEGFDSIAVTANDGKEGKAFTRFAVTVLVNQPARISHAPLDTLIENQGREVTVTAFDVDGINSVLLNYRRGGERGFTTLAMNPVSGDSIYSKAIPNEASTSLGLEYYLVVNDKKGGATRNPEGTQTFSVPVYLPNGVRKKNAQPHGKSVNNYRLVSVPIQAYNNLPRDILEDDLGPYEETKWRFSEPHGNEYPNTSRMIPGKAFWLIVKDKDKTLDTGAGKTTLLGRPYEIPLNSGWNYIANPFNFAVFADERLSNSEAIAIFTFIGEWSDPINPRELALQPFEGYAILSERPAILTINPENSSAINTFPKAAMSSGDWWSLRIVAQCREARDRNNLAAVATGSALAWDRNDQPEPPGFGEYVSVYFPHQEWGKITSKFCYDFRPAPLAGDAWDFEVITNIHDKIDLTFEGLAQVPGEFEVWLLDEKLNLAQNLREDNHYSIAGPSPANPKRLQLAVGRKEYVGEKLERVLITPASYELSQNFPNPFNPATTIRYGLPQAERVTLKVYNMLGEEVAALLEHELKAPGYHTAIWNGRNRNGEAVGSGVYVYKLEAGSFASVRKAMLLR